MASRKNTRTTDEDQELLSQLGVDTAPVKKLTYTVKEQRIIAGFEEIGQFYHDHQREPMHGEGQDIFERLYAVRLDQIRASKECRALLDTLDTHGLLALEINSEEPADDEALLAALGADSKVAEDDLTLLKHVRTNREKQAAEEIAQRTVCNDFGIFKPLFIQVQSELNTGTRNTRKYKTNGEINLGDLFILDGQKAYVAELGEKFTHSYGIADARLRVIYDNGTESDILMRSLQRALYADETSRRITATDLGPLFSNQINEDDCESGNIYILRSLSEQPAIAENRNIIHKIGLTKNEVKKRVANAKKETTYLLSEVEIVHTVKLANINRNKFEALLHQFFADVRLDLVIKDRFNQDMHPQEWFLVPLPAILNAIDKIEQGTLADFYYDPESASVLEDN